MGMPLSDSATVTMCIRDFRATEAEIDRLRAEASDLRKTPVQSAEPSLLFQEFRELLDAALPIIQLAVGQLDPATVQGWPYVELERIAGMIVNVYPDDANLQSLAIEFRTFAAEARRVFEFRVARYDAVSEERGTKPLDSETVSVDS